MLTPFETAVLAKLLAGDHPTLAIFREQLTRAGVRSRTSSGAGFFLTFDVPADSPVAPVRSGRIHFGDVAATFEPLKHGAGFVVFVRDGRLETLEGYSYDEPWLKEPERFELAYTDKDRSAVLRALEAS
jgi:hypothetical protein